MPSDPDRLQELFLAALEMPEAERAAFLDRACGSDVGLRAQVDRLLAAHVDPASVFKSPIAPLSQTGPHTPQPDTGTIVAGRYKLLDQVGEGGMGTVWMAQQTEPVKRMVAIKLIKPGMDSKSVLARFEAERQALALMDHPNIAKVLDAGVTNEGHPFFVMELVKGVPITQFCDTRRLTPQQRLELFVPVCHAIQHAHQKGVIHRDLKPSNIMVGLYDDRPVPKVIDFGVAKAMGQPLTDSTFHTGFGTVIGTPQYMSPEQATFNNLDVDTRSDIYSLGVVLYELLVGSPPFTKKELETVGMMEMLRVVREVEPPRPSTKLSAAETLPTLAAQRSTEPRTLAGMLRNELDWIVMKALEKDRTRRYETANGFAADVQRYLAGEAVLAVPPSAGYRLRKFLRKNSAAVKATLAIVLVLVLGSLGTVWGLLNAAEKETARVKAEAEVDRKQLEIDRQEQAERQRYERNFDAASSLLSTVENSLTASDAKTAGQALAQAEKRLAEGGADDLRGRLERCRIELVMLRELDRIDDFRWSSVDGRYPPQQLIARSWAEAMDRYGVPSGTPAIEVARRINESLIRERLLTIVELWFALDGRRQLGLRRILELADPDEFRNEARATGYARALLSRAFRGKPLPSSQPVWFAIGHGQNRLEAHGLRESLLLSAYRLRPNNFPLLMTLAELSYTTVAELSASSARDSLGWYRAALAVNPTSPVAWNNLGNALQITGDLPGAIAAYQEAIRLDPKFAKAYTNLGAAQKASGHLDDAIASHREAIRLDPKLAEAHSNLGIALKASGHLVEAIASHREAIRLDPRFAKGYANLGADLDAMGDLVGAIAAHREAIHLNPSLAFAHNNLGISLNASGDHVGAIAAHKVAILLDPNFAPAHCKLGLAFHDLRNLPAAIESYKEAIRLDHKLVEAHSNLGQALREIGDMPGAIRCYKEAVRLNPMSGQAHSDLGAVFKDSGNLPAAIASFKEALRLDSKLILTHCNLGNALNAIGDLPGAIVSFKEAIRLDPKFAPAHYSLGFALFSAGDLIHAVPSFKESIQHNPKDVVAHTILALTYVKLEKYDDAIASARDAIRVDPKWTNAYAVLGLAFKEMGDIAGARAAWAEAARLEPKRYGPLLAQLPPLPLAPPPREVKP